ncbi:MAG: sigma-54-dependent Fis family transcriptional regulator [Bacteroidales bacterium]|jgi:DNA-binding NtrC family response regulator|nr:sigma-54-dependent Fis family transcriptional regulator [Bacteroidales bacterium]
MKKTGRVIVVDDNAGIRTTLKILLPIRFAEIEILSSPKELLSKVSTFNPDAVLLDMNFTSEVNTGNEGLYWLTELKTKRPNLQVVLFTAYADISLAVEGMKRGAFDFVVKPWDNDKLLDTLAAACERTRELTNDNSNAPSQPKNSDMYWGSSDAMRQIRAMVDKIAPTDATVLITGENGTGKDVLAREIHMRSERHKKPMVAVDAGAITETLFESELFGHVKGAFTDAHTDHVGKFEQANGSTLFLDEIGNIPLHLQAKLLRVLQNRCVVRVGDSTARPIDIRLICATNMNLEQLVKEGKFREDLYYRINTMHIELLPLRERRDDIVPLAERFVIEFANKYHRSVIGVDAQAASKLREYRWRGNIRELQNCIEKAVILSEGNTLTDSDIQLENSSNSDDNLTGLDAAEEKLVRSAVERCNGNISAAAKMLGISRPTLYTKMKKYGM